MTDRELLELAAKAAGYEYLWNIDSLLIRGLESRWNPIADDGDALRLAVKLNLVVLSDRSGISAAHGMYQCAKEVHGDDPYAATRRAIVRAAAEIGRNMT
jgi:hypothetical protein